MIGPFGLRVKSTMRERALPMARAMAKRGHSVAVVIPPWDSPEDAGQRWIDSGVNVIHTPGSRLPGALAALQLTGWLVKAAIQQRPDVIHCFKPKAYAGLAHLALHTFRQIRPRAWKLVIDEDDWEQAWNDENPYSRLEKRLFAWQEPWGLRRADAVTVASLALQSMVTELRGSGEGVCYVPNGVRALTADTSALAPAQIRAKHGLFEHPTILVYTRFVEFELPSLVAVIRETARRVPEARWLVVGRGFFGEEHALAQALEQEGMAETARFAGWTPASDLPAYFAASDAALHLYEDTLINQTKCSVKLLDLLAAGVPVVASRVGQNSAYIEDGRTGLLVPPGDAPAHADALALLLNDPDRRRSIGQAASAEMEAHFSWDALVGAAETAYVLATEARRDSRLEML